MIYWIAGIIGWLLCAILTTGMTVADFQNKFKSIAQETYRSDLSFGVGIGLLFGPIGTLFVFFFTGFAEHGLQYRRTI